jgi:DNA-binding transcriptional LysR family regulator
LEGIDLRALDLNLLVALDALLRQGNVTAAARDLGVTQPALSRTLQRLRDTLGDPLLVRVGRGVVPTDRARALAEPLADALRAVQRVFSPPDEFDPGTARGELTIGLGDEAQFAFADAIVGAIWAHAPHVDIRVRALTAASLDEGRRGVLDFAIGPDLSPLPAIAGSVDYRDFVVKHLYTRRFVVVSSARNPRRSLTLAQYLAAHHVIVGFDGGGRGFVDDLLAAEGHTRRVAATVTSFSSAVNLVANTDLLATVPLELVRVSNAAVVAVEAPFPLPTLPMLCVWHPRRTADPRHRFLREVVMRAVIERMG